MTGNDLDNLIEQIRTLSSDEAGRMLSLIFRCDADTAGRCMEALTADEEFATPSNMLMYGVCISGGFGVDLDIVKGVSLVADSFYKGEMGGVFFAEAMLKEAHARGISVNAYKEFFYDSADKLYGMKLYDVAYSLLKTIYTCLPMDERSWFTYFQCLYNGYGVQRDVEAAYDVLKQMSIYDCKIAIDYMLQHCDDPEMMYCRLLGEYYRMGYGGTPDMEKAIHYMKKAAGYDDAESMYNLGILYSEGELYDRDKSESYFLSAGRRGYMRAYYELAQNYMLGHKGYSVSRSKAEEYYNKVTAGRAELSVKLGCLQQLVLIYLQTDRYDYAWILSRKIVDLFHVDDAGYLSMAIKACDSNKYEDRQRADFYRSRLRLMGYRL